MTTPKRKKRDINTNCGEEQVPSSKHHPQIPNRTPFAWEEYRKSKVETTGTETVIKSLD